MTDPTHGKTVEDARGEAEAHWRPSRWLSVGRQSASASPAASDGAPAPFLPVTSES